MPALRRNPKGRCTLSTTTARAFIYTHSNVRTVKVRTRTSVNPPTNVYAANTGLTHIGERIKSLPYLKLERVFTVQSAIIHDIVVEVGLHRFLVCGFHDDSKPVNGALKKAAPGFNWRGEVVIIALGRVIPYLSTVRPALARIAIIKFMASYLSNLHTGAEIPLTVS